MGGCGEHGTKWQLGCKACQAANKINKQMKAGTLTIEPAPASGTEFYQSEIRQLIQALGLPWALTTDWSGISDFAFPAARIRKAAKILGVEVRQKDLLLEVAVRMRVRAECHDATKKDGKVLPLLKEKGP